MTATTDGLFLLFLVILSLGTMVALIAIKHLIKSSEISHHGAFNQRMLALFPENDTDSQPRLRKHPHHRQHCTFEEMKFQIDHFDFAQPWICAEDIWKNIQMMMPEASVFIDVGANRGYFAAMLFGLWSPGHAFNRKVLFQHLQADGKAGKLKTIEQLNTYCKDGLESDTPITCYGRRYGDCASRKNITVHSFDGQETHYVDANYTLYHHFPHLTPSYAINRDNTHVKGNWIYNFAAVTNTFDEKSPYGYFLVVTHETGRLVKLDPNMNKNEILKQHKLVKLESIDHYCNVNQISNVDVVKIDAEGGDLQVIEGAFETLTTRNVKLLLFECFNCLQTAPLNMVQTLFDKVHMVCYMIGYNNLLIKLTHCIDLSLISSDYLCTPQTNPKCPEIHKNRNPRVLDGNVICAPRGSMIHQYFEKISLLKYMNEGRGDIFKDAMLGNNIGRIHDQKVDNSDNPGAFVRFFGRDPVTLEEIWKDNTAK